MNNPLVSIIVPVYNVEKYLKKCVQSLVGQTYENIEIILIDDGSKDSSGMICDELARQYNNVIVKHQENGGCSRARNAGYSIAQGECFMFMDSDDVLSGKIVEELVSSLVRNEADVVLGTMNRKGMPSLEEVGISSRDAMKLCINQREYSEEMKLPDFVQYINPGSPCVKLIKKNLFEKSKKIFEDNIKTHHEDTLFSMEVYRAAQKIVLVDSHPYLYNLAAEGSLTKTFYNNKIEESLLLMAKMEELLDKTSLELNLQLRLKQLFATEIIYECWSDYFTNKNNRLSCKERKDKLKELLETEKRYNVIGEFESMKRYKYYQIFILTCMKKRLYYILSLISIVWPK